MEANGNRRTRNLIILFAVVFGWIALDRITKSIVEDGHVVGDILVDNFLGFRFQLVHNSGAAWGAFSDATGGLSIVSMVVIAIIIVYSLWQAKSGTAFEMVALGLLGAGGIGNLIDRLAFGQVTDFIMPLFIDFPTFNVADIGVTCGVIMLVISIIGQLFFQISAEDSLAELESEAAKKKSKKKSKKGGR